jgi:1-deoxy-D-xylulose-5-phosphate reductoisomerase
LNLRAEQIDVVVHPQSIVHSLVQFEDGSMKAQMGLPDMKLPIQYALTFPYRLKTNYPRFNFMDYPNLTFEKAYLDVFRNLNLAYEAMRQEGVAACYLNAANEIAVDAFLNDKIQFVDIFRVNEETVVKSPKIVSPVYEDYVSSDREARILAAEICSKLN